MEKLSVNMGSGEKSAEKEKPLLLYHASVDSDIQEFVPTRKRVRSKEEGSVVFATPDRSLASIFLIEGHNDSWTQLGFFGDIPYVAISMDREEFIRRDKGGCIYSFSSEKFGSDPNIGMGKHEWISREPVKPIEKERYQSTLDTMIENGVQVFFVNQETFKDIARADDEKLLRLLAELPSENERRGVSENLLKNYLEEMSQ